MFITANQMMAAAVSAVKRWVPIIGRRVVESGRGRPACVLRPPVGAAVRGGLRFSQTKNTVGSAVVRCVVIHSSDDVMG